MAPPPRADGEEALGLHWLNASERVERLLAVAGSDDRVPATLEQVAHRLAQVVFVFNQEDRVAHRFSRHSVGCKEPNPHAAATGNPKQWPPAIA